MKNVFESILSFYPVSSLCKQVEILSIHIVMDAVIFLVNEPSINIIIYYFEIQPYYKSDCYISIRFTYRNQYIFPHFKF